MSRSFLNEEDFIKGFIVRQFNKQYQRNINPKHCSLFSLPTTTPGQRGYEVVTDVQTDHLRMRYYFTLTDIDHIQPFRLKVDRAFKFNTLGDEVYVTTGTLRRAYLDEGMFNFRWRPNIYDFSGTLLLTTGFPLKLMSGRALRLMGG